MVDAEDVERLGHWKWQCKETGKHCLYAVRIRSIGGKRKPEHMHRLIARARSGEYVDHVNGNTLDNRKANLRICTHQENMRHRRVSGSGSSKYKGVCYCRKTGKWLAHITVDKKQRRLGLFGSERAAADAYNAAAKDLFADFALLNPV